MAIDQPFLCRIHLPDGGVLTLSPDWRWTPDDPEYQPEANLADLLSSPPLYDYSPAHGQPGCMIGAEVAKELKGRVEFPPRNGPMSLESCTNATADYSPKRRGGMHLLRAVLRFPAFEKTSEIPQAATFDRLPAHVRR